MPDLPDLEKISFASNSVRVFGTRTSVGISLVSRVSYVSLKTDRRQEVNCNLNPSFSRQMSHSILCIEPGSGPFSVDVDMDMKVEQLQQIIWKKMGPAFSSIPAVALRLYKINIDVSNDDEYARTDHEIASGVHKFNEQGKLNFSQKVSKYLQQDLGDVIQVLVKLPSGETIDPFAGAVAESRSASIAHCTIQKHQQAHDRSLRIIKQWAISVDARTEFDIRRTLHTPLTNEEKIPITKQEYDDMLRTNLSNQEELLTTENLDTLFRVSNEDAASMLYKHIWVRIINNTPHAYGTESSFHSFWDDQIGRTLRLILNGTFIRDSNRETSTGLLRPDYGFLLRGHCLFRGEEKPPGTRDAPLEELKNKIVEWTYSPLDYILGESHVRLALIKSKSVFLRVYCCWCQNPTCCDN